MATFNIGDFDEGKLLFAITMKATIPKEQLIIDVPVGFGRRVRANTLASKQYRNNAEGQRAANEFLNEYSHQWALYGQEWMSKKIAVGTPYGASGEASENIKVEQQGDYWVVFEDPKATSNAYAGSNKVIYHNLAIRHGSFYEMGFKTRRRKRRKSKFNSEMDHTYAWARSKSIDPDSPWGRVMQWMDYKKIKPEVPAKYEGWKTAKKVTAYKILKGMSKNNDLRHGNTYDYVSAFVSSANRTIRRDVQGRLSVAFSSAMSNGYMYYLKETKNKQGELISKGWSYTLSS